MFWLLNGLPYGKAFFFYFLKPADPVFCDAGFTGYQIFSVSLSSKGLAQHILKSV